MKILVVEDNEQIRKYLVRKIIDAMPQVVVVAPTSYKDLMAKLSVEPFDCAIIDIVLTNWGNSADRDKKAYFFEQESNVFDGRDIAVLLAERIATSIRKRILIYSTYDNDDVQLRLNPTSLFSQTNFTFVTDIKDRRHENIIKFLEEVSEDDVGIPTYSLEEFKTYNRPQKLFYYKSIFSLYHSDIIFDQIGNYGWISNQQRDHKTIVGRPLASTSTKRAYEIAKNNNVLASVFKSASSIPIVFWNFQQVRFFEEQCRNMAHINPHYNDTLDVCFSTVFSERISELLISNKNKNNEFSRYIDILTSQSELAIIETQNNIIKKYSNVESEGKIKSFIKLISGSTGFEVLDLFEGVLDSFDEEHNIAFVTIKSLMNADRVLKKELSYTSFLSAGIEYKESTFLIWTYRSYASGTNNFFIEQN